MAEQSSIEDGDLDQLIARIRFHCDQAARSAFKALEHWRSCGECLISAKAEVPLGDWREWCWANLSFGERQARKYMRLANHWPEIEAALEGNRNPNSPSSLEGALRLASKARSKPGGEPFSRRKFERRPPVTGLPRVTLDLLAQVADAIAGDVEDGADPHVAAIHQALAFFIEHKLNTELA